MESSLHPDNCISVSSIINELKFAEARKSVTRTAIDNKTNSAPDNDGLLWTKKAEAIQAHLKILPSKPFFSAEAARLVENVKQYCR